MSIQPSMSMDGQNPSAALRSLNRPHANSASKISDKSLANLLNPSSETAELEIVEETLAIPEPQTMAKINEVLADYVYVSNSLGKPFYFQKSSARPINKDAFARRVASLMPLKDGGKRFDPLITDKEFNVCDIVDQQGYRPRPDLPIYQTAEGVSCANTYREPMHPKYKPEMVAEVGRVLTNHMSFLFGKVDPDNSGAIMLSYLAHIIQAPEKPALWAVLLFGEAFGTGKTLMLDIVRNAIGASNYQNFDGNSLKESFTSMGANGLLHVIEEVHLDGNSRWTLLNDLKPRITNSTVKVRLMYQDAYDLERYARIVATSNYADALPITEPDRRWCVLQTYGFETTDALLTFKKTDTGKQHYEDLAKLSEEGWGGAVKEFFQNFQINPIVFDPCQPPMTTAKTRMAHASRSDATFVLLEALESHAGLDITKDSVINITRLKKLVGQSNRSSSVGSDYVTLPARKALGYAMSSLGFRTTPNKFDYDEAGTRAKGVCYIHRKYPDKVRQFRDNFIRAERNIPEPAEPIPESVDLPLGEE